MDLLRGLVARLRRARPRNDYLGELEEDRVRWFGPTWHAPVCDPLYMSAAPLGEFCQGCDEQIVEGERGLILVASPDLPGSFYWWFGGAERSVCCWHIDCFQQATLGSAVTSRREDA